MNNMQNIKGEYFFDISIFHMFGTYHIHTYNTNLITDNGISFFLNKWVVSPSVTGINEDGTYQIEDGFGYIGYIGVGTSNIAPSSDDTSLINQTTIFYDTKVSIDNNQLVLNVTTKGSEIDDTCEIGVYTTNSTLVSRDVHTRYSLPDTSSVELKYVFTLNQTNKSENSNEEDYDD